MSFPAWFVLRASDAADVAIVYIYMYVQLLEVVYVVKAPCNDVIVLSEKVLPMITIEHEVKEKNL